MTNLNDSLDAMSGCSWGAIVRTLLYYRRRIHAADFRVLSRHPCQMANPTPVNSFLYQLHEIHPENMHMCVIGQNHKQRNNSLAWGNDVFDTAALGIATELRKIEDMIDCFNKGSPTSLHRLKERHLVYIERSVCE